MLALLEALVVQEGGSSAMCDTDSMAIVANEEGGLIPCPGGGHRFSDGTEAVRSLPYARVEAIRERFSLLNPYAKDAVPGTVLHSEETATCHVISAKRYALYSVVDDQLVLSEKKSPSEHGLGHLLDPSREDHSDDEPDGEDLDEEQKQPTLVEVARSGSPRRGGGFSVRKRGSPLRSLPWLDRQAITRLTISSPALMRPFDVMNKGRPYSERVKPSNFMLVAHVAPFGLPSGADPARFRLVAPYEPIASQWPSLPWCNLYDATGQIYTTTTRPFLGERGEPEEVRVQTLRDVLRDYRTHPEAKSLGPRGEVCTRSTVGLLIRRPIAAATIHHIGKEANRLEEVNAGIVGDLGEVLNEYQDLTQDPIRVTVLPFLQQELSDREIARGANVDHKTIAGIRNGAQPRRSTAERLWTMAVELAAVRLTDSPDSPEYLGLLAEANEVRRLWAARM